MDGVAKMRIGIMGGTFNPIHKGHLSVALCAYRQFDLEYVAFLPSRNPPHKKGIKKQVSDVQRLEMVHLATASCPFFRVSDLEMKREGDTYTSDTLAILQERNPLAEYYFIVGADSLHDMKKWHEPEKVFSLAHIISAPRFPATREEDYKCRAYLEKRFGSSINFIEMQPVQISSSEILQIKKSGGDYKKYLPLEVYEYIEKNHLYEA